MQWKHFEPKEATCDLEDEMKKKDPFLSVDKHNIEDGVKIRGRGMYYPYFESLICNVNVYEKMTMSQRYANVYDKMAMRQTYVIAI